MAKFKYFFIVFTVIFAPLFFCTNSNAQQTVLYVAASDTCDDPAPATESTLYRVDPSNGNYNAVGPIGFEGVTGMAQLGDGRIVASAQADTESTMIALLIEIIPSTGQGVLIGQIGDDVTAGECGRAPDLTYDPVSDTLFAIGRRCEGFDNSNSVLMEINKATGQGSIIGDTGDGGSGNGLAISNGGTLFWATNVQGPDGTRLFTINPANGVPTLITALSQPFPSFAGFAFHPDTQILYTTNLNPPAPFSFPESSLEIVNTTTGLLTLVGELPECSDAITFARPQPSNVPTLSEWGLIAMAGVLGIIGLMAARRKKVTA